MWMQNRFVLGPLAELWREMERLRDEFGLDPAWWPLRGGEVYPAVNVWDAGDALCLEAEIPGVRESDMEIFAVGNELTLRGRRPEPKGEERTYHRRERATDEFSRTITLPVEVDSDKIEASLKDGVLTLRLPKAEAAKPRKITVRCA